MLTKVLINGRQETCIDVRDRGFQYGDGVFETIAFKDNRLQFWEEHLQRMRHACQRLSLDCIDESVWLEDIKKLQLENDAVIKLIVTRGVSGRGYACHEGDSVTRVAMVSPWPNYTQQNEQGIVAMFCKTPVSVNAQLAGIKHLNRLENVLARNEWQNNEIAEGFMLDNMQHVIEGTMTNVFCVLDNELYTPSLEQSGVDGVMRKQIIKLSEKMNIALSVIEISKQNFLQMDAVFVSNSIIGLWAVNKIIDGDEVYEFAGNKLVTSLKNNLFN